MLDCTLDSYPKASWNDKLKYTVVFNTSEDSFRAHDLAETKSPTKTTPTVPVNPNDYKHPECYFTSNHFDIGKFMNWDV